MKNRLWDCVRGYFLRRLQRQLLLAMDERTCKDLAISRVDAEQLAGCYGPPQSQQVKGEFSHGRDQLETF